MQHDTSNIHYTTRREVIKLQSLRVYLDKISQDVTAGLACDDDPALPLCSYGEIQGPLPSGPQPLGSGP